MQGVLSTTICGEEVKNVRNKEVRNYAKAKGIKLWQIAAELGLNDGNFSRKLRFELPAETKSQIFKIIDELSEVGAKEAEK